jgi:drug/metabolite transporter (DMT)-like permease
MSSGLDMSDNRRAMLLMITSVVLWAAVEALAAPLLRLYSPYQVVWTRYATHIALMVLVWGWREPASLWRTRRPGYQLARSLLMVAMPASWVIGMQSGVWPDTLMAIFWASPLIIMGLARVLAGERARPALWAVALAGYLGALVLHPPGRVEPLQLLAFPVGMALSFSLYVVMTRSLRTEPTRANLFYTAFGVLIVLTPFMPGVWIKPAAKDLLAMIGVGVIGYFALLALDRMAHAAPVSISAPFTYLQIPASLGIALAVGAGGGHSMRRTAVGLLLIAGTAICLWVREPRLRIVDGQAPDALRSVPKEQ